jgi:hypothetical protein
MNAEQTDDATSERIEDRLDLLEHELAELREEIQTATNRDIPLLKGTLRTLLDGELEGIDAFPDAGRELRRELDAREARVGKLEERMAALSDVGSDTSTKAEKFAAILAFAANKRSTNDKVAVTPSEIRGCTGVSRRYAYDLIEAMDADIDGVRIRDPDQVTTRSGDTQKRKALLVDCDRVHADSGDVNQFTTGGASNGSG